MSGLRAVVFDFDFTLVDSSAGFDACHRFVMNELGLPATEANVRAATSLAGTPLPGVVRQVFPNRGDLADTYADRWQAKADEVMTGLTHLLPGARETVRHLQAAGLRLGIVSQKRRYRIEDVLRRDGMLDVFATIVGAEDAPQLKPDPRGLLLALQRLETGLDEAIYVGDTTIDAETARRAGVGFVAVLTGFTSREDFTACETQTIVDTVAELPVGLGL